MAETDLNFGPEWIRNLTTGSTSAGPPLPNARYSLAQFRYGREEMLALLPKDPKVPKSLKEFPELLREKFQLPLALVPQTEEEQRLWGRSVNSEMALRAKAGYRPGRGGSVDRGRGRGGRGGYTDEGYTRNKVERSLSASDKEHGRWEERDRRYDRPYNSVQRELQRDEGRGPVDNWRKYPKEDDADWRFRSNQGNNRSWRRDDKQPRNTKWKDDTQQGSLPEWSFEETAEPDTLGTFDSSGAFLEKSTNATVKEDVYASDDADDGQNISSPEAKKPDKKEIPTQPPKQPTTTKSPKATATVAPQAQQKQQPPPPSPKKEPPQANRASPEDDAFAHHQKATENMVAKWTEEIEVSPSTQCPLPPPQPPHHPDTETHWFYQDPQGNIQGPFSSGDMLEWYNCGYFAVDLMVRRACDEKYTPLGELIEAWGRNPFLPGDNPPPPPLKSEVPAVKPQDKQQLLLLQQQLLQQQLLQRQMLLGKSEASASKPQDEQLLVLQQQLLQQQLMQQQLLLRQAQMQQLLVQLNKQDNFASLDTQQQQQILLQQLIAQTQMPSPDLIDPLPLMGLNVPPLMKNTLWPQAAWSPLSAPETVPPPSASGSIWDMESPDKDEDSQTKLRRLAEKELQKKKEEAEELKRLEEQRREEERKMLEELQRQREEEHKRLEELKRIEEAERQRQLEELRKQQEEELRRQEELKRQQELQKQQEELKRQEELRREELRKLEEARKKQQQEELKKQEELRRQEEAKRKLQEEMRRQEELRREELRKIEDARRQEELKKQQEELKRKEEIMAALKQKELERQRLLEEEEAERKRIAEAKLQKGPAWGAKNTQPNPPEMSLADIQRLQEEKEREELKEKQRKQMLQKKQEIQVQQVKSKLSWAKRANDSSPAVKSLMEIQLEEAEILATRTQSKPLPPPPPVNSNAGVWGNSSHLSKITNNCVPMSSGFWDDVPAPKKQTTPTQRNNASGNESAFPNLNNPVQQAVTNSNKTKNIRAKKEEDAVARLFGSHHKPTDEFTKWCMDAISAMPSSVDVPTFVAFLKDIDSPYEVYDYVKSYFGEGKDQREFAKQFLEKRSQFRNKAKQPPQEDNSLWGPAPAITPPANKPTTQSGTGGGPSGDGGGKANNRRRKNRMQRLDSSLLGFTVQSNPDRLNVGEIDQPQ